MAKRPFRPEKFFAGMSPEEVERKLLALDLCFTQLGLSILKRLGGKRRVRDWRRSVGQRLEHIKRAHDAGHPLAAYDALAYSSAVEMMPPRWAVNAILATARSEARGEKPRKKPGRHARIAEAQHQRLFDWMCRELVKERRWRGSSERQACEHLGDRFHLSRGAILAAVSRAKKRGAQNYFSATAARTLVEPGQ